MNAVLDHFCAHRVMYVQDARYYLTCAEDDGVLDDDDYFTCAQCL